MKSKLTLEELFKCYQEVKESAKRFEEEGGIGRWQPIGEKGK